MKLVVDINVLVSGSLWRGNPSRLVDALLDGSATLCASAPVLAEFEEVIQRAKFRARLEQKGRSAQEIISRFRAAAQVVEGPSIPVPSTLRDPDDIHVLACAMGACADAIVTGDNDLLAMETFEGISILSVRQALDKLGISPE
ncbi:MAG TPA: putative toxin-antitoxin system toxin component, PIN family [Verrucomicrobiae bacterium]|nr:putative toxin-antitoxin system toxin component, PIN family [Verrucomicrobiae bacterium]